MADVAQGPGWWLASDGRWYPPHLHPSYRPPATAPRPGWWLASDGRWYPPEARPPQAAAGPAAPAPSPAPPQAPPAAERASGALATGPGTAGNGRAPRRHKRARRRNVVMLLVLLGAVLATSAGIAIAKGHRSRSPATTTSSTLSSAQQLAASHHAAQAQAFDQLVGEIHRDIGPCVQQTETVGSMLGILRLLGGSNVTPSQIPLTLPLGRAATMTARASATSLRGGLGARVIEPLAAREPPGPDSTPFAATDLRSARRCWSGAGDAISTRIG